MNSENVAIGIDAVQLDSVNVDKLDPSRENKGGQITASMVANEYIKQDQLAFHCNFVL